MRALDDLVRQGKVRYIGNSNFPAWRIAEAELVARGIGVSRFVSCQDEYSLLVRDIEKELLPAAQRIRSRPAAVLPAGQRPAHRQVPARRGRSPRTRASPRRRRLRDRYMTTRNEAIVEKLQAFAQARGHTMLELAFSWLAARPQVSSVIAGATQRRSRSSRTCKAIEWTLSAEDMAEIDKITLV